ncbi:TetR/AcrR family transcriptional regulator [Lunatimonas salinarum]|uniref:TetR/AcrR family transcriptional regulator n=1 Tax=Lunatimonas salinarum TaxID=1774590 RepID=UPI001AE0864D|nr:TetR/AcrR family transcriptional regulator [Lunatimonas salinarum]
METRDKIISVAIREFSTAGIKSVTMDQIAREAGISKKTIYQEFKDKKELVYETFFRELEKNACKLKEMEAGKDGVIEHLIEFSRFLRERFTDMHPMVLNEIKRYYPESWALFEQFKEEYAIRNLEDLIERGKELGYFRPEINARLLALLPLEQISLMLDPSRFSPSKVDLGQVQLQIFDHFLHGMFTEKGRVAYQEQMNHQL